MSYKTDRLLLEQQREITIKRLDYFNNSISKERPANQKKRVSVVSVFKDFIRVIENHKL